MTAQKYTPEEAAHLRDQVMREQIVPVIRRAFDAHPTLQTATLLVAQYWNDEANDAVHCDLFFSELDTPDTAAAYAARRERYDDEDMAWLTPAPAPSGWARWFPWLRKEKPPVIVAPETPPRPALKGDRTNLPSGLDESELEREFADHLRWDSNGEPISLFAAFCREDCHQEMDDGEAYSPYAIFRRRNADVAVEIVGVMIRPWLDGVKPEGGEQD
jgi:hypothetical protein